MKFVLVKEFKLTLCLLLSSVVFCWAQNKDTYSGDLSNLTYDELYDIMVSDGDSLYIENAFSAYVKKAKNNYDTLEVARALRLNAYNLKLIEGIKSVDSSITIANSIMGIKKLDLDEFMAYAHYTKGALFYDNDKNYLAANEYIKSYNLARRCNNYDLSIIVLIFIADIKAVFGQEDEAILLQRKTRDYLDLNKTNIEQFENLELFWVEQMSRSFLFAMELDSANKYIRKGLDLSKKYNDKNFLNQFKTQSAKLDFYLNNFRRAKDTLERYNKKSNNLQSADDLFYLGMIEGELGNQDRKRDYFLTIDSLLRLRNYPLRDNCSEIYQFLLKDAVNDGNTGLADHYLKRVVYYDSLLLITQKNLREITLKKFDLPMQEEEKESLGNIISSKSKWLTWLYIMCGCMLIGLTAYFIKYKRTKNRLARLMGGSLTLEKTDVSKETKEQLDEETVAKVLQNLEIWEQRKGFLENSLTQQSLAKELNTNSSYLSKVINVHKSKNFASYLKDIRITYAINDLKENPKIVKTKSMIQIAEMYGFNSISVFTKCFKDKTGVTPGVFFKRILDDQWKKSS
ncbi:helix-turn-helix transcriptional regulator [Muricauda ruestringensis]|uniref:Helix-turn-helix transcriptional regulator n=1 Tax=Flagellimonas aurea TaxID=2915619 RepID=A0ABS3G153_9FLAO|nr:helix-turn-helix transcriptional regulator [Allomuricauda aurea]MBO0353122.1 helix-turn-helix transcriptional regulator [Allomuricauda aurea]